jgi:hypothetical protein
VTPGEEEREHDDHDKKTTTTTTTMMMMMMMMMIMTMMMKLLSIFLCSSLACQTAFDSIAINRRLYSVVSIATP